MFFFVTVTGLGILVVELESTVVVLHTTCGCPEKARQTLISYTLTISMQPDYIIQ
jgi:hypothetical protein